MVITTIVIKSLVRNSLITIITQETVNNKNRNYEAFASEFSENLKKKKIVF